jgi:phenylalanyl-tRNA synthetase beta chain
VTEAGGAWLTGIEYLDTFQGGNLADSEQSVHFGLTFRHPERTLTGEEVDRAVGEIVKASTMRLNAKLRS